MGCMIVSISLYRANSLNSIVSDARSGESRDGANLGLDAVERAGVGRLLLPQAPNQDVHACLWCLAVPRAGKPHCSPPTPCWLVSHRSLQVGYSLSKTAYRVSSSNPGLDVEVGDPSSGWGEPEIVRRLSPHRKKTLAGQNGIDCQERVDLPRPAQSHRHRQERLMAMAPRPEL